MVVSDHNDGRKLVVGGGIVKAVFVERVRLAIGVDRRRRRRGLIFLEQVPAREDGGGVGQRQVVGELIEEGVDHGVDLGEDERGHLGVGLVGVGRRRGRELELFGWRRLEASGGGHRLEFAGRRLEALGNGGRWSVEALAPSALAAAFGGSGRAVALPSWQARRAVEIGVERARMVAAVPVFGGALVHEKAKEAK